MNRRLLIGAGAGVALCAIGLLAYFKYRDLPPEAVLARLPSDQAPVLSIDFAALRKGGFLDLLSGPVVDEEPEYRSFVQKTGFDYRRDLDHALISFPSSGVFFLIRGRFDWNRLESYAREQGGACSSGLCRMPGSQPGRKISFFLLRRGLMAMAVSPDEFAAAQMKAPAAHPRQIALLNKPVWLSLPASTLKNPGAFPEGTQLFAKAIQNAESATVSVAPSGKAVEAQLEVVCRDSGEASVVAAQFQRMTAVLRQLIEHEKQKPNPADLSGVLTAGAFRQEDRRVLGSWPIERAFIENLAGKP